MGDDGLIIVGGSLAGAKAAEGARTQGWDGPIRLVGAETYVPYERPPLTKGVLIGTDPPATDRVPYLYSDQYDRGMEIRPSSRRNGRSLVD